MSSMMVLSTQRGLSRQEPARGVTKAEASDNIINAQNSHSGKLFLSRSISKRLQENIYLVPLMKVKLMCHCWARRSLKYSASWVALDIRRGNEISKKAEHEYQYNRKPQAWTFRTSWILKIQRRLPRQPYSGLWRRSLIEITFLCKNIFDLHLGPCCYSWGMLTTTVKT